jgi:hypothetical protein
VIETFDGISDALIGGRITEITLDVRQLLHELVEDILIDLSPVATMDSRARCRSWSTVQSSAATPDDGHVRRPRFCNRYKERKVITRARFP